MDGAVPSASGFSENYYVPRVNSSLDGNQGAPTLIPEAAAFVLQKSAASTFLPALLAHFRSATMPTKALLGVFGEDKPEVESRFSEKVRDAMAATNPARSCSIKHISSCTL